MYGITDLKKGILIELDGEVYEVVSSEHSSKARGAAVVRAKLKNLATATTVDKTFQGNDRITPASVTTKPAQYLYADKQRLHFMLLDTYDQISMDRTSLSGQVEYLIEGQEVSLRFVGDDPLDLDLPIKIELEVVEAEPGIKGNSAGNVMKSCRTETGLTLRVPLFVEAGDRIVVDSRDGSYVERA